MNKESFEKYLEKYKEKIINGKEISEFLKFELKRNIEENSIEKYLSAIIIGDDENSKTYIKLKNKFAIDIGICFNSYFIDEDESEESIISTIDFLNNDEETSAILVQLPLPKKFDKQKIISKINPEKDIDGFLENSKYSPIIGNVVLKILSEIQESFEYKKICIISNSEEFYKKLKIFFENNFKNVTIFTHKYSDESIEEIKKDCLKSDAIISMVGKKHFIDNSFIKKDTIIFDAGITKENGEIFGDVYLDDVIHDVKYITPPINGIGPLTVACLFENLIKTK